MHEPRPGENLMRSALLAEGALVFVAIFLAWLFGIPLAEQLRPSSQGLVWGLAAAAPMALSLILLDRYPIGPFKDLERVARDVIVPLFRDASLGELLLVSILAGLGEEMLFRGVAQVGIAQLTGSAWIGLLVASLLFGLAHPITATYIAVAGLIGVYFGWLLLATGDLTAPITAHAAYDFFALVYLLRGAPEGS